VGAILEVIQLEQLWNISQSIRTLAEYIVKIHYKETTSENIEDFMCVAVTVMFRMCKPCEVVVITCSYKSCV
jgi:hypothetical protein